MLVELPTYDRALKILREAGQPVVAVAMDDEGLVPERLEDALAANPDAGVPLHDPDLPEPERAHDAGRPPPAGRRARRRREHAVVEDDPYGLIRFEGEPQPSLFELSGGTIIYTSSFSKTIAPGLRVGWYIVPEELAGAADRPRELDLHHAGAAQPGRRVRVHPARQLRAEPRARQRPARRRGATRCSPRSTSTSPAATLVAPARAATSSGSSFPRARRAQEVLERAEGVTAVLGTDFGGAPNTLRLAFSFVSPDEIDEGVARLAAAL